MADNITVTQGTGTTIATEDVSGVQHQKVKVEFGTDGVATLVSSSDPLPVTASSLPLPSSAATSTKQSDGSQKTQIVDGSGNVIGSTSNALNVNISSGSSSGTEYTEDAAAAANPAGPMTIARRKDTLSGSEVSADGDNIAVNATSKGEVYVKHVDAIPITDNSGSLTVDGTVAVSGTVTVGSHAVTNAGTFAVQVDGSALTSLQLADDVVATLGTTTYTEASTKGTVIGAIRRDADTTLVDTTNEVSPLQVDANGRLKVEAFSGETLPVSLTSTTVTGTVAVTDNSGSLTVDYATTGSGTATGALRVELPTNGTGVIATVGAVTAITNALPAGTNAIGKLAANSGVDIGDIDVTSVTAGTTATSLGKAEDAAHASGDTGVAILGRRIDTAASSAGTSGDYATIDTSAEGAQWATLTPTTTSGCSIFKTIDLDETEEDVKTSAGNVYGYYFANTNASARYLKWYNATAANVTVGTTTPVATMYLPPTSAGHVGLPYGIGFSTAITVAATTGVADADTGAPGANDVILDVFYK